MTEAQMDMSLDDIIKATPKVRRGKAGGGGGGGAGAGGRGRSSVRGRTNRGFAGNRGRSNNRTPYSRETPQGKWRHDRYGNDNGYNDREAPVSRGGAPVKLLISNLEYSVNDQDIRELFSEFGALKSYSVHYDRSGRSLGTADVIYLYRADATRAVKTYNDVPLDGKPMRIELVTDEPAAPVRNSFGNSRGGRFNSSTRTSNRGSSRPSGRGAARGGRGGGGRGAEKKKPLTAEELDAQLDEYKKKD